MRFPQVPIGQRFTYQGRQFTKNGPLTATEEGSGKQRMVPRSSEVTLIDTAGRPMPEIKQRFNRSEVGSLIRRFKAGLIGRLREMAAPDGTLQLDQVIELIQDQQPDA